MSVLTDLFRKSGYRLRKSFELACAASLTFWSVPAHAYSENFHRIMTENGLPFLKSQVLTSVVKGNRDEDDNTGGSYEDQRRHAQNCLFKESAEYVNFRYRDIIEWVRKPETHYPGDETRGPRLFGHILHGLQDFYSHSNWVRPAPEGLGQSNRLLNTGLGYWSFPAPYSVLFDDVVLVSGNPPSVGRFVCRPMRTVAFPPPCRL